MSVWLSKYVTILDFCVSLVVQWSVGAEGRAPSAQHTLVSQQRASTTVVTVREKLELLYPCAHRLCPSQVPQLQFPTGRMAGFGSTV